MTRAIIIALVVANLLVLALGLWGGSGSRGANGLKAPELEPNRINIVPPNDARIALKPTDRACVEWGAFDAAAAGRAELAIAELSGTSGRAIDRRSDGAMTWWVFVAPQANRRAAEAVVEFLRRSGVNDYAIVSEEPRFVNAVSLGVFTVEQAAVARREQLVKLGLRDVNIQEREIPGARVWLRLREMSAAQMERLSAIGTAFTEATIRDCP